MPANTDKKKNKLFFSRDYFWISKILTQQPYENKTFNLDHIPFEWSKNEWEKNI